MLCQSCGFESPEGMRFCGGCGVMLRNRCPGCGFDNPPGFKFCGDCGTALAERAGRRVPDTATGPAAAPTSTRPHTSGDAERRQLTVMFCDLVDSTPLSQRLDPEDLREVLLAYQGVCGAAISRFGGSIAQYLGDGLLVYFGYPQAHEDDAQRAVHAALAIVEDLARLDARLRRERGVAVSARVAVHTGLVVVGDIGAPEQRESMAIVGETPNVAARLQGLAAPNTVVISVATHRLVKRHFICHPLGVKALKGLSQPIPAFQVLGESGVRSRFDAVAAAGLTPLVGRSQEVGLLLDRWAQARDGAGHVVLLDGEPGVGKSRLIQVLKERMAAEPHLLLECQCSPYHQNSALYPIIEMLERLLAFHQDDTGAAKLAALDRLLQRYRLASHQAVALIASLLSLPLSAPYAPITLTPERMKRELLETLLLLVLRMAAQQPLLCVMEDLHWVDASTLELLDLVVDQVPTARILAVLSFRPEFTPAWPLRSHLAHLSLSRLPRGHTEEMVERVAGGISLPDVVVRQIAERTDGVPLFVEELTKTVLESGVLHERDGRYELSGPLPAPAIPVTLQDSLLARLDRLAGAKEVAQWGAMLGREFAYQLLQAVTPLDETTLQQELARLVGAELLYQRGVPPEATYVFKHALVQETAYESLLRSRRLAYHRRIAEVLAERFPAIAEIQPEVLARHATEAGLFEQAVRYWQRAGQRAIERSASAEAIGHLSRGLELLTALPDIAERAHQELELQLALGLVLMPTKGYGSSEVEAVYKRALELCRRIGETPRLFSVLRGLWEVYDLRADMPSARELAKELLRLASSVGDRGLLVVAHDALGESFLWPGEFARAREHLEHGIALYNPEQHRTQAFMHGGYDAGVVCRSLNAHALWYLGFPDQALVRCREALALARELPHAHTLSFALSHAAVLYQYRRESQAAQEHAEAAIALASEHGFVFWVAFATIVRGWALAEQGEAAAGIDQIRQGMAEYRAAGSEIEVPLWLTLLAQACTNVGQIEAGLDALAEALAIVDWHSIPYCLAEVHRLRGELVLGQPQPDERHAEAAFREAIAVARRQQAKSLELRAATSLARLWQRQGKQSQAHAMLIELHRWFDEGFDTVDLRAAEALIDATAAATR